MQRLHQEDLTGYLLDNMSDEYEHKCIPGEIYEDNKEELKPSSLISNY